MITNAIVILRYGRKEVRLPFRDSHGVFVGNTYMLNIDGSVQEWRIVKIIKVNEGDEE